MYKINFCEQGVFKLEQLRLLLLLWKPISVSLWWQETKSERQSSEKSIYNFIIALGRGGNIFRHDLIKKFI